VLKGILQDKFFYCNHLGASERDEQDIMSFVVCRGPGLERYLRYAAFPEEDRGEMRTYIVRDKETKALAGYFSLKAGMISTDEHEDYEYDMETGEIVIDPETGEKKKRRVFKTIPGVELANFAVNDAYIDDNPEMQGMGVALFNDFVLPLVNQVSETIGVKMLYIFALPFDTLIDRYSKYYGFTRLDPVAEENLHRRLKPEYDDYCKFMYRKLKQ